MSDYEVKDGTGYLWHETTSKVLRKGTLTLDGRRVYCAIIESTNDKDQKKYEFMTSAGLLHLNDEKMSERSPDIGGGITLNNKQYKLGGWAKVSEKTGSEYTSISLEERSDDQPSKRRPKF